MDWTGNLLYNDFELHLVVTSLALDLKILGLPFGLKLLYFTGFGLENTWILDLEFNCYLLTGFRLENTWTTNLDYDY